MDCSKMKGRIPNKKSTDFHFNSRPDAWHFTGCGPSGSGDGSEQAASSKGVSGSGGSDAIYKTAGSELTDYAASFLELQEIFEEALKEGIPEEDMDVLRAQMVRTGCDLILATLGPYDVLDLGDEAREEGELMLSGIAAVREKDGNKNHIQCKP